VKPKLKPPGTKRFKLKCDKLLSNFAFKFNVRRYIQGNQLTSVSPGLAGLTALTRCELGRNLLTSLPAELGQLAALAKLNLSENKLTSVPAEFGRLPALRTLNLRYNKLTSLPAALGGLTVLEWLDISGNQLAGAYTRPLFGSSLAHSVG